ncbi:MAG: PIN domain-containing protein [Nanoarchaeota archaeon]|nr:PIN domain-containing protein [Nanoarchaeota archaeon]
MEFVVDTNIVFSLFKGDSFTRGLIEEYNLKLFSPASLIKELNKYRKLICFKSKISEKSFEDAKQSVLLIIKILPESKDSLSKAKPLISHKSDVPFLALSLDLDMMPIWSNDPHLKKQSLVNVYTTSELHDKLLKEKLVMPND